MIAPIVKTTHSQNIQYSEKALNMTFRALL